MTDQPQHHDEQQQSTPIAPQFNEAPYSGNVRARIAGYDWQLTIRAADSKTFIDKVNGLMTWLNNNADRAVNVDTPHMTNAPQAPTAPVAPQAPAAPTGPMTAQCVMIEVGTSYQGGKTQLKFNCNGLEHPLTYTKEISDMVKLLAPLGFTAAHIVVGQKYPVNCVVTYAETSKDGKTYKNVQNVKAA